MIFLRFNVYFNEQNRDTEESKRIRGREIKTTSHHNAPILLWSEEMEQLSSNSQHQGESSGSNVVLESLKLFSLMSHDLSSISFVDQSKHAVTCSTQTDLRSEQHIHSHDGKEEQKPESRSSRSVFAEVKRVRAFTV